MIIGIGTDILHIQRLREILNGTGKNKFLHKTYTKVELQIAKRYQDPVFFLAERFAGKEAVFKCFRCHWMPGDQLTDIEILSGDVGEPIVVLHGRLEEIVNSRSRCRISISLSYENDYAVAFAVLEDDL